MAEAAGLSAAIDQLREIGMEEIRDRAPALSRAARRERQVRAFAEALSTAKASTPVT